MGACEQNSDNRVKPGLTTPDSTWFWCHVKGVYEEHYSLHMRGYM